MKRRDLLRRLGALSLGSALDPMLTGLPLQQHVHASGPMKVSPAALTRQLNVFTLTPFVDALPLQPLSPGRRSLRHAQKRAFLSIKMREIHASLHRDLPPTRMWSYGEQALAPVIEAQSRNPIEIEWINALPSDHFLPIDHTLHGCGESVPTVRNCVHVHGARVPSEDDGHPEDWYTPGKSRRSVYPLNQDAACLWYHDHAMGINRLNLYAGLFGLFIVRDEAEHKLALPAGQYELPLILYDRLLTVDGQLLYPDSGIPGHPWVSDFHGDALIVNGKIRPYHNVMATSYRLRLLNASNSRFYDLSFSNKRDFLQIGSDQGFLSRPVSLGRLVLAPGERADLIIDFSDGDQDRVYLRNGAFDMLEFRVDQTRADAHLSLPKQSKLRDIPDADEKTASRVRTITLNEYKSPVGDSMTMLINRKAWHETVTEQPVLNSTEIWEFVNQTEDIHPMHLHLVRFRILSRQPFDTFKLLMDTKLQFTGPKEPPSPNEEGWKDVVQCGPGLVTRILVKFEGYAGKYLYHCHIMEHEANDMMRPFAVLGSQSP